MDHHKLTAPQSRTLKSGEPMPPLSAAVAGMVPLLHDVRGLRGPVADALHDAAQQVACAMLQSAGPAAAADGAGSEGSDGAQNDAAAGRDAKRMRRAVEAAHRAVLPKLATKVADTLCAAALEAVAACVGGGGDPQTTLAPPGVGDPVVDAVNKVAAAAAHGGAATPPMDAATHQQQQQQQQKTLPLPYTEWAATTYMEPRAPVYSAPSASDGNCLFHALRLSTFVAGLLAGEVEPDISTAQLLTCGTEIAAERTRRLRKAVCTWFATDPHATVGATVNTSGHSAVGNSQTRMSMVLDYECLMDDAGVQAAGVVKSRAAARALERTLELHPAAPPQLVRDLQAPVPPELPQDVRDAVDAARQFRRFVEYVGVMACDRTWGGGPEIIAFADNYDVAVEVYELCRVTGRLLLTDMVPQRQEHELDKRQLLASRETFPPQLTTKWGTVRLLRRSSHYESLFTEAEVYAIMLLLRTTGATNTNPMGAQPFHQRDSASAAAGGDRAPHASSRKRTFAADTAAAGGGLDGPFIQGRHGGDE